MKWLIKFLMGSLIVFAAVGTPFCQKAIDAAITDEQKKILMLYVSEYITGPHDYLYHQSVTKEELFSYLEPPLKKGELRPSAATEQKLAVIDTLFTQEKLRAWSKQIASYQQGRWNQHLFPDGTKFITDKEIPDWRRHNGVPPPGEEVVIIYHISKPFIIDKKYALLYVRHWSGPANVNVEYIYFEKKDGVWQMKAGGRLNATT